MKLHLVLPAMCAAICTTAILMADDGPVVIRNKYLEVRADRKTGEITILAKGKPILTQGQIGLLGKEVLFAAVERHNGPGDIVLISKNGRAGAVLRLGDDPFVVLTTIVRNRGKESETIGRTPVFCANVAFATPNSLKLLGTGGLESPAKQVGSYMWLTVAKPECNNGIVAGFVTTGRGSGVIFAEQKDTRLQIDAHLEYGHLTVPPSKSKPTSLETFVIGYFDDVRDGLEAWADDVAKTYNIKLPPQPSGYCTWYHAGSSNEKAMVKQTEIAAKELKPYGFSFEQIDDGWQDGESHNGPRRNFTHARADGPYPSGMKQTADMITSHGITPGIWFMPFAGTYYDSFFKDHQDWFAKQADGSPYETAWGGTCLDMTNPDARQYVQDYVHRLSHDWGYRFFKMDGLSTGCAVHPQYVNLGYKDDHLGDAVLHDPSQTNIEAFRSGLKLVREAAGPDVFLLGCCASQNMRSYGGAFGLVDAMRVGPDNGGGSWNSVLTGPRIASRHYHLNGRIWYNDADVAYVRNSLTLDQARANTSWVNITGQLFMVSDDFSKLTPDRLEVLKRVMPAHGQKARPVDLLEEEIPRIWLVSDGHPPSGRGPARRDVLALFNWDDNKAWDADYPLDRTGLPKAKSYAAFDFWGNRLLPPVAGRLKVTLPKSSCLILAMRPESDHPQLISTSRHVTQGMIDVTDEKWDPATQTLSGTSKLTPGDLYELRIATGGKWKAASVSSNLAALKPALSSEEGLVRVGLTAAAKEPVEWRWAVKMQSE